jgi:hypothetical protein
VCSLIHAGAAWCRQWSPAVSCAERYQSRPDSGEALLVTLEYYYTMVVDSNLGPQRQAGAQLKLPATCQHAGYAARQHTGACHQMSLAESRICLYVGVLGVFLEGQTLCVL